MGLWRKRSFRLTCAGTTGRRCSFEQTQKVSRRVFCVRGLLLLSLLQEYQRGRESRMPAAPAASHARTGRKRTSISFTTGVPNIRLSLHDGLTAYTVLSPAAHCDRRRCIERLAARHPGRATLPSSNLNTSPGCQDHTASPYASCLGRRTRR